MRIARGRSAIGIVAVAAALALAGCVATSAPTVSPTAAEGATIIFESIDGPPRPVSARLAKSLDQEAAARRLVVVTRGGQALYLIRAYVAAHAEGGTTVLAWAFDVYDAERKRAFRLRGEERTVGPGSWAAANDEVIRRIAATSIAELMTFIASDRTAGCDRGDADPGPGTPRLVPRLGAGRHARRFPAGSGRHLPGVRGNPGTGPRGRRLAGPAASSAPPAGQRQNPPVLAYSVTTE